MNISQHVTLATDWRMDWMEGIWRQLVRAWLIHLFIHSLNTYYVPGTILSAECSLEQWGWKEGDRPRDVWEGTGEVREQVQSNPQPAPSLSPRGGCVTH